MVNRTNKLYVLWLVLIFSLIANSYFLVQYHNNFSFDTDIFLRWATLILLVVAAFLALLNFVELEKENKIENQSDFLKSVCLGILCSDKDKVTVREAGDFDAKYRAELVLGDPGVAEHLT